MPPVELRVRRFDPERDAAPHWESYHVEAEPTDMVLDLLNKVKWEQDGTLTYRRSCAHGVCGSDAMLINGINRLACKTHVKDLRPPIVVEAIRGYRVLKDMVVDMEPFFAAYRDMKPWLIAADDDEVKPGVRERIQSPEDRARFDDTTKCILCAACTTSCPSFWANDGYVGPAAIVNAHRFVFDSRDVGADERLVELNKSTGVWRCRTIFNCTDACPRGIHVTEAIQELKRELLFKKT